MGTGPLTEAVAVGELIVPRGGLLWPGGTFSCSTPSLWS